ncbi:hypothetical protein KDW82_04170 [Burkholderia vietnamiensis]|uniref:hypothetical protein n=1 Tax=Burkholderia vietnamiensis TaxID=60552 RepID=UPI001B9B4E2F|nr:hypothetical protein [Burkholderia vietnamiensis]MBR8188256.1 hypothetical protein [Burkholderia vietnamiensis]
MDRQQMNLALKEKLESLPYGRESIKVFGAIRCNVHIVCVSRNTADKWALALAQAFRGANITVTPHRWHAAENKNSCLCPSTRDGFLIGMIA